MTKLDIIILVVIVIVTNLASITLVSTYKNAPTDLVITDRVFVVDGAYEGCQGIVKEIFIDNSIKTTLTVCPNVGVLSTRVDVTIPNAYVKRANDKDVNK